MSKRIISTPHAPAAIGTYSQAVAAANVVYMSGQIGLDPRKNELAEGIAAQTKQVLANLEAVLGAAGCTLGDVVKTTVFLADMADFDAMNKVYAQAFAEPFPARSTVAAKALPKDALVEIEVVAIRPGL